MRQHTLIIGGTGILRPLAVACADRGDAVSVVARGVPRLTQLIRDTLRSDGVINIIPVDYHDTDAFRDKLTEAIAVLGPVTLAVARVAAGGTAVLDVLGEMIGNQGEECRFIDVVGCSAGSTDSNWPDRRKVLGAYQGVDYQAVRLEAGSSDVNVEAVLKAVFGDVPD